jgi:hypothetical protein
MAGVYYPPPNYPNVSFRLDGFFHQDFAYPGAEYTQMEGVTGPLVIGWFIDGGGNIHGLRWESDEHSQFDFAGGGIDPNGSSGFTFAFKINHQQDVVGSRGRDVSNPESPHGYLIDGQSQREISFDFPEAISTSNHGINDAGVITGSFRHEQP